MDSHLLAMRRNLDNVRAGVFPEEIRESIRTALQRAADADYPDLQKYILLHDISKPDCLTITRHGEPRILEWSEWQDLLHAGGEDGTAALAGDGEALFRLCEAEGVSSISYYQNGRGELGRHGPRAAIELSDSPLGENARLIEGIRHHEVGFQFEKIRISTYDEYFGRMSQEDQEFGLVGSYIDLMASVRSSGGIDLESFHLLADSYESSRAFRQILSALSPDTNEDRVAEAVNTLHIDGDPTQFNTLVADIAKHGHLQKGPLLRELNSLRDTETLLPLSEVERITAQLRESTKVPTYNIESLREAVLEAGVLNGDEVEELLTLAAQSLENPQGIGRRFGKKMQQLRPILAQHQE